MSMSSLFDFSSREMGWSVVQKVCVCGIHLFVLVYKKNTPIFF